MTAVGDGAVAATSLEKYVSSVREKLQIPEFKRKQEVIYGEAVRKGVTENAERKVFPRTA